MNDDMSDPLSNSVRNRKRLTLIALMALFLSPVLAAWLWTPDTFRNRGELIDPPQPLVNV
ncbi:MAG TPA: cytochrome oxidase assembly protein, partial [Gammaproteobacteria bacterium]|nr:cytochrome oxidase assembly protein [Gammaproteobacteria bacterium]